MPALSTEEKRVRRERYVHARRALTLERVEASDLSWREKRVLVLHFGLDGEPPKTLDETGRYFNVSFERARQLCHGALAKLRP